MTDRPKGLGELDWLPDRSQAEASLYRPTEPTVENPAPEAAPSNDTAAHQQATTTRPAKRSARKGSSKSASNRASGSPRSTASTRTAPQSTPAASVDAPPPPSRKREVRVQFNHRVLIDRHDALDQYRTAHGATWQAIVDQMVDEYLTRRGLSPGSDGP